MFRRIKRNERFIVMSIFGLFLIVVFAVLVTWAGVKISKV